MAIVNDDGRRAVGRRLLRDTPVRLYYRLAVLDQALIALRQAGYHIAHADASRWLSVGDMHRELARVLHFPGYYGENLDALNDCLRDVTCREYGFPADATGLVLVLTGFAEFAKTYPAQAHGLLDVFACQSREAMLAGEHLICLVQADDPALVLPPVGATPVMWNDAEWLNASRGL